MRKIDETKKDAIIKAVFQITSDESITNLSIAKIAKKVGVSKATMYVYYDDKTDMLSKIFLDVKQLMDDGLDKKLSTNTSFEKRVRLTVEHFADKFVNYPYEINFMWAILANPDLVHEGVIEKSQEMVKPLYDLFTEGVENNYWITNDMEILVSIMFSPIKGIIETYFRKGQSIPQEKMRELIDIIVKTDLVD